MLMQCSTVTAPKIYSIGRFERQGEVIILFISYRKKLEKRNTVSPLNPIRAEGKGTVHCICFEDMPSVHLVLV